MPTNRTMFTCRTIRKASELFVRECECVSCPGITCVFMNARIIYLLISNRLVIIRLSSTAAIGIMHKLMIFFYIVSSHSTFMHERFCLCHDAVYVESTMISYILYAFSEHFSLEIGLSDCIVCIHFVPHFTRAFTFPRKCLRISQLRCTEQMAQPLCYSSILM